MVNLYYVVHSEMLTGGVIEAQVVAALRAHARVSGQPHTKLIFLEPARVAYGAKARDTLQRFRAAWPEGDISIVPYVSRFNGGSPGRFLAAFLAHERLRRREIVFHCRGPEATYVAHVARTMLGKGRVIFDVRGPAADETIHRLGCPWPTDMPPDVRLAYEKQMAIDRRAASVADAVFVVSPGLERFAVEQLGADAGRVTLVPSCVESLAYDAAIRDETRREWGVDGDAPVFLYSGRLGLERVPHHMLRVFRAVLDRRPDAKFVLFCYLNDMPDLDAHLRDAGVPESAVVTRQYPRDEAVRRLCGADAGLLFCEPAARYRDWFPIKFPEYLSAGLGVLMNSLVGALPQLVEERAVGWIVDLDASDDEVRAAADRIVADVASGARASLRQRSLDVCSELYLWRNVVPSIRSAYGMSEN
jgi:glycosyltransferase involved in cell wall biosynthesis